MEQRQDSIETEVRTLAATVARVETNQTHAEELNKLRFESQKTALDQLSTTLTAFIGRIEGIIDGSIETAQSRQAAKMVEDYFAWRRSVDEHVDASNLLHTAQAARGAGIVFALSGGKAVVLTLVALAGPVIALVSVLTR